LLLLLHPNISTSAIFSDDLNYAVFIVVLSADPP
jgi:hypothetical protein